MSEEISSEEIAALLARESMSKEMTDDAISRRAAIEKIHWLGLDHDTAIMCDLAIRALPSVIPSRSTEPCEDAISRQAAIEAIYDNKDRLNIAQAIRELPSGYPHGREVLDKIRAEIEHLNYLSIEDGSDGYDKYVDQYDVLQIIDKYKAESK